MQHFIDSAGPFELPTSWAEVTTAQFCAVDPLMTVEQRASYFAGRPIQVNGRVADALEWMLSAPPTGQVGSSYPWDLGQETYLQVETIRSLLAANTLHKCFAQVYATFVGREKNYRLPEYSQTFASQLAADCMEEWPEGTFGRSLWMITETYPAVAHCLAELQRLGTKYAELAEPDPTEAAQRARDAGADELLGMFSHFNVAKALAQQMGITLDAAYQLPFETVCVHLLHERRTAILSDNIQRNAKHSHE